MTQSENQELTQRVDEVLHYVWDPIGVSDAPEARDEYSSYVGHVVKALLEGQSKTQISDYLTEVATDRMGLDARKEHDDEVAELLIDWARYVREKH